MASLSSTFHESFRISSAPAGDQQLDNMVDEAEDKLLSTLQHDETAATDGLTLTPSEVLVLKHMLRPRMIARNSMKDTEKHLRQNAMAARHYPKSLDAAEQKRRSSFTSDASRRRRLHSFSRFDGLEEIKKHELRVSSDLDPKSVKGVFHLFEDHLLWRKHRHGKQFFRGVVRKVIHMNRAKRAQQADLPLNARPARLPAESSDGSAVHLNIRKRKGMSFNVSRSFQQDMMKFETSDVLKYTMSILNSETETNTTCDVLSNANLWDGFNIWSLFDLIEVHEGGEGSLTKRRGTVKLLAIEILEKRTHLLSQLHVSPPGFMKFMDLVCEMYSSRADNPYHNALHGADVMQSLHAMLVKTGVVQVYESDGLTKCGDVSTSSHKLSRQNHFGALLAALCHDIGHPGLTNRFLVRSSDPMAIQYNDQSVLENMHVATTLRLAQECLIFSCFTNDERRAVRRLIIEMILETDMSRHIYSLWKLEQDLEAAKTATIDAETRKATECGESLSYGKVKSFEGFSMKNYVSTLSLMLHACDLGNPAKPWPVYRKWTNCVMEEFYAQSAKESELNMNLTLPTRETCKLDQFQIGFIRFIKPFFSALNRVPELDLSEQLSNLSSNEKMWRELGGSQ